MAERNDLGDEERGREDDFTVTELGGDPQTVLGRLRTRLLDLTLTNRLLNFKEGARTLRVVDELPDQLFTRLRNGDELEFLPVPEPPPERRIEESRKQDRQRAAAEYGREIGLSTDFELPVSTETAAPDRHTDKAIQTALFPQDLERCLRTIGSEARSAIEEKGSNILYLVFGFLEWFTREDSEKRIRSPLMMLPVSLRRGDPDRKTGAYRFYISYSDEDVLPNISLQEKMRRDFQISIPDIEDEEAPDAYLARIKATLPLQPGWQVRRQVSLGLLIFTKLLMYRDLDPRQWPKERGPAEHPQLLELFRGGTGSQEPEYAREYDFEANDGRGAPSSIPPIIMDADSSQHSAIVDAMAGRSMVIEGPPGTGKSQTIANLIAAALGAGKTVLFVADKLTALEVVRRRLDDAGLGLFCLELHSDKTQKSRLLDDVRRRVEARGTFREPAALQEGLRVLRSARESLNAYARMMKTTFGCLGWTVHEILWGAQRRRRLLGDQADHWAALTLPAPREITLKDYEDLRRTAATFAQTLANVRSRGSLSLHPFWGAWPNKLTPDAEEAVLAALKALNDACVTASACVKAADALVRGPTPQSLEELAPWMASLHQLQRAATGAMFDVVPRLSDSTTRDALSAWCDRWEAYRHKAAAFRGIVPDASARRALDEVPTIAIDTFKGETSLDELGAAVRDCPALAERLTRADAVVRRLAELLEEEGMPRSLAALQMASAVVELAASAPFGALAYRPRGDESSRPAIEAAIKEARALRAEREQLGEAFDVDALPAIEVLESSAVTCAGAGLFAFLSSDYRECKRRYARLSRSSQSTTKERMAAAFKKMAAYARRLAAFVGSEELRVLLGPAFRGIDTNFEAVETAQRWQDEVHLVQGRYKRLTRKIAALAAAEVGQLRELSELVGDLRALKAPELITSVQSVLAARAAANHDVLCTPLSALITELSGTALAARPLCAAREELARGSYSVAGLAALRAQSRALSEDAEELLGRAVARDTLAEHFNGLETAVPEVRATISFAATLFTSKIEPIRSCLAAVASREGFEHLVSAIALSERSIRGVLSAEEHFCGAASIVPEHWYGESGAVRTLPVIAMRTARAVSERDALAGWVAYLRARTGLCKVGLDAMRALAESDERIDLQQLPWATEFIVYQSLARALFVAHPELSEHDGLNHAAIRERFREYDRAAIRLERERLACEIDSRAVPEGVNSSVVKNRTEYALLRHELTKQKKHLPIRQLVNRAGEALRGLKPCFMMSPRSVAQYLEAGRHRFDLVVMDEASQLRPEDAIGAIARGSQTVIVGDSKQLPPTSFFSTADAEEDTGEELVTENKESILDLARTAYRPARQLRWHYRSRHGSLIAFSNARYYDNTLVVFPGPREGSETSGIRLVELSDAVYADGQNMREAEHVTDAVIEHLKTRPSETFGVVALNIRQKELIESLVYERLKEDPELRARFDRAGATDAAFIKNLESVQGDERDVIYISVTYGPSTAGGRVARRFGPINSANGWRRLNVLFTRAKLRVVVFASFRPEQLQGGALSRGAQDLCDYISFARTGKHQEATKTDREPSSDFEIEVAEALRDAGYSVTPQVGVAGYFIDIGVRRPDRAGEFLLGVECDGATYHASFSARDRDRLRQDVLENLGWKIHRIWSTDWFRDPRVETQRLVAALRAAEGRSASG